MTPVRDFQDKEELTRFVEYCEDDFDYSDSSTDKREQSLLKRLVKPWSLYIFFIHFILIFAISLLWIRPFHSVGTYPDQSQDSWSPAQRYIEYEMQNEIPAGPSPFSGLPTEESDRAWDELVKSTYFNATMEELEKAGENLHNISELTGGGYLATIGVYHELHCVEQLRTYLYKDRYYPKLTASEGKQLGGHVDHCIDVLLKTIMCHGNTAFRTYTWNKPGTETGWPSSQSTSQSRCVKWSSLQDWSRSRMIPIQPPFITPSWYETGE